MSGHRNTAKADRRADLITSNDSVQATLLSRADQLTADQRGALRSQLDTDRLEVLRIDGNA